MLMLIVTLFRRMEWEGLEGEGHGTGHDATNPDARVFAIGLVIFRGALFLSSLCFALLIVVNSI
ncbi:hypothetical protein K435DRAFT_374138 [Dendrothele bispora CBS 962.96]|uniref:Uncharacterized protein n=1 Tax=Dendrothele bispora (strain CBS 962.96) TaxID=1314807 RepID=A0A4S8LAW9_DENBC|nr:hypothetical protein K435DRAFT_374138 [Dendrothele bispora CBS 962.96]